MRIITVIVLLALASSGLAQSGVIQGRVYNSVNNEPVPLANVVLGSTGKGVTSDFDGIYRLENLEPGTYNISASSVGFKTLTKYEIRVMPNKPTTLDFPLVAVVIKDSVVVTADPFIRSEESPLSLQTIGAAEIYRNPGGNRDISKVITSLPGVATTASFRNDIIIRGGAPNENRFYLDGIEVPNINHFATQGSSGGPVGMINVSFIREVELYTGAFPANRGNTLSSVMEFKQISGNDEKLAGSVLVGSSDIGLTLDGPLGDKSNFIFSIRRSYLQFLFTALGLPFLPTYNDAQFKYDWRIDRKNKLTILGLGAIDDFSLNKDANDGVTDADIIERNNYILDVLPVNTQWNYTIGAKWTHFRENSYHTVVVSRNHLNNSAEKYKDNIETLPNLVLDYNSQEIENKLRFEHTARPNNWKINVGVGLEQVVYTNSTYQQLVFNDTVNEISFNSRMGLVKYGVFGQVSRPFGKLTLSLGVRADGTDYSSNMNNPLDQISPRLSASYAITEKWSLNTNIGRYFQLPAYTVMGYRDAAGDLANAPRLTYVQADHLVAGVAFTPTRYSRFTVEGFYKIYDNYPFLINDSISLANLGGEFGVIGNEPAVSNSQGRAFGMEFMAQQKLSDKLYGILAYTWVTSEFKDKDGNFRPSAWDNRHVISLTAGRKFKRNWEVGAKFRLLGGAPYTPYNIALSSRKVVWDVARQGLPDWSRLNELRFSTTHALDIRIDKTWYFKKWTAGLYLDIQNVYNFQSDGQPFLNARTDASGNLVTDPNDPTSYSTYLIEDENGTLLPSIGLLFEF